MKRWRYKLKEDFVIQIKALTGIYFVSPWLIIENGLTTIKEEYAWDGVTPAIHIKEDFWIGVWDGPKGSDGKVVSWKATLVHDALCQFIGLIPNLTKEQSVSAFKELLELNEAPKWMSNIYPFFVNYFGPQDWSN